MEKLIVYVDDAAHALEVLQPLLAYTPPPGQRQWIVVACAPRVTHHVSKWVTHSARESWRGKWSDKLFAQLLPRLQRAGEDVLTCAGKNNLQAQTEHLLREHGPARVIDARRPKQGWRGHGAAGQPQPQAVPSGLMGLWLTLATLGLPMVAD